MSIDSREKGKRIERIVANALRKFWPQISRNANAQSQGSNGLDLINTGCFDFEVKGGDSYKTGFYTHVQSWIEQVSKASKPGQYRVVWFRPDKPNKLARSRDPKGDYEFVIIPSEDFKELLNLMKIEGII